MPRRLPKWVLRTASIAGVALLVNGCVARVGATPPDASDEAPAPLPIVAEAPPSPPAVPLAGLDARVRQATSEAAKSGADVEIVVMDRNTGEVVSNGDNQPFPIASVVKLFIADDLLLQESQGTAKLTAADHEALDRMLRSSDDGAAQTFWDRSGGSAIIARVKARYGLANTTAPWNGHWDVTTSTASDLVRYYDMLLDGTGGLPPAQAGIMVNDLAQSTPTGIDGYPQRFGIPEGLYAEPVAVKQGWFCCWNGSNQLHVSTGAIGPDRRYVVAISSLQPVSEAAARASITQAVKTMFPTGKI